MKPVAHYLLIGLLFLVYGICHADSDESNSFGVNPATPVMQQSSTPSVSFPDSGCEETNPFLLPAAWGEAGVIQYEQTYYARPGCVFRVSAAEEVADYSQTVTERSPAPQAAPILPRPVDMGTDHPSSDRVSRLRSAALHAVDAIAAWWRARHPETLHQHPLSEDKTADAPSNIQRSPFVISNTFIRFVCAFVFFTALVALLVIAGILVYLHWFSERAILARRVRRGLRNNEFHLDYQPIFYVRTRTCVGLEITLRWKDVTYGPRGEAWFVGKLADDRLATKVTEFILSSAEQDLRDLPGSRRLYLMVTLWGSQLRSDDCLSLLGNGVNSLMPRRLILQICAEDLPAQLDHVTRLRDENIRIGLCGVQTPAEIDHSRYSGNFEFVKIDRKVLTLEASDRLRALHAIAAVGRQLDVAVIADGVESVGQQETVGQAKIEFAQGFFFGKAVPANQLSTLLSKLDWRHGKYAGANTARDQPVT